MKELAPEEMPRGRHADAINLDKNHHICRSYLIDMEVLSISLTGTKQGIFHTLLMTKQRVKSRYEIKRTNDNHIRITNIRGLKESVLWW